MATAYDRQQWCGYLNHGYRRFDELLFTPGIGLIVSPDGRKIIVIGEEELPPPEFDEEERICYISVRNGGIGAGFTCPSCEQYYVIALEEQKQASSEIIYITNSPFFDCNCGVGFVINDKYEFLSLPFLINELAPLYLLGMSRAADLLLRYQMPEDSTLVEQVGTVSRMPNDASLTSIPGFQFANWCGPGPGFVSQSHLAYNVDLWRVRTYTFGSEIFEEKMYHPGPYGWERIFRDVKAIPDQFANERLLKMIAQTNQVLPSSTVQPKKPHGGDTRAEELKRLSRDPNTAREYARLVDELAGVWTTIKGMADPCSSEGEQSAWVASMWERSVIKQFVASYPKLTPDILRRAVDNNLDRIVREPRLLAYYHGALELQVDVGNETMSILDAYTRYMGREPSAHTFRPLYKTGKTLLNQSE